MTTRRINTSALGLVPQGTDIPAQKLESLTDQRKRRVQLLRSRHYQPLITEVLNEELLKYKRSTVIDPIDRIRLLRNCVLTLASASPIFEAAIAGNLVRLIETDPKLQDEYKALSDQAHHQPSIYAHLLTDDAGIPPTPNHYIIISNMIQDYTTQKVTSQHAWQVDNVTHPPVSQESSNNGHRKYLHTKSRSSKRVEILQRFCIGAQKRWLETPAPLRDTPFAYPPGECGYSRNSHTRLRQHRARQSSNYVMNLVEDICTYLHRIGVFTQRFTMHQYIIFLIFRPEQAAIAEIFCSGLLQVWVDGGGGFNAYPAGLSVATAGQVRDAEWAVYEGWVREESGVVENMRVQRGRAEEWLRALEWEGECVEEEEEEEMEEVEEMEESGEEYDSDSDYV
jgi:hypothetical protein